MKETTDIINLLKSQENDTHRNGMARYGIATEKAFGIPVPYLRSLAKNYKKNHELALELWEVGYHETRLIATMTDDYKQVTETQMDQWVQEFDSWDICDQCCSNLFDKTTAALKKTIDWSGRDEEFVKRAGFTMMACLAVHNKKMEDRQFLDFLPIIIRESTDQRNFVRKSVNWALRQIGKRNIRLYAEALSVSEMLMNDANPNARWIGKDAYKELSNPAIINRLKNKK